MASIGKEIEKILFVKFTEEEALALSREAAVLASTVSLKKDELKSLQKTMKADIDDQEGKVNSMLNCVKNNGEYRDVTCKVHYDRPARGQVMVIRNDTGETVETRAMTAAEMQRVLDFEAEAAKEGKALLKKDKDGDDAELLQ